MGKNRKSKRQLIRDEKRKKKRDREFATDEPEPNAKRQRVDTSGKDDDNAAATANNPDLPGQEGAVGWGDALPHAGSAPEKEFFGMLTDEEQEYFRHADELLELNDFPSDEERAIFLQNVYKEAEGKELKLASSQSCSRLMERLILLSNTQQKKHLFQQYSSHFISLITHRFASHCCEKLFLQSAPIVTEELGGDLRNDTNSADGAEEKAPAYMEDLFLYMLDELEEYLSFLLSDRYASHTLRILLLVLSGRPLDRASTKSLLRSRKKENVTVVGARANQPHELSSQNRVVPQSFTIAARKVIADATSKMDDTALRILAKHPTGNPVLQLCLELDIILNTKDKDAKSDGDNPEAPMPLLDRLIPNAPSSFKEEGSSASDFVNSMLYDPIGSRLLETLITHCPGKVFRGLQANLFGPRIHNLLRNDIASYPAIRVLNRLNREDLVDAVQKSLPQVPILVEKGRFNVLKTFFERCSIRKANTELDHLINAIVEALGGNQNSLVSKLCFLEDEPEKPAEGFQQDAKNAAVLASHGSQLVRAMLGISGSPCKAVQSSISSLSPEQLLHLATSSPQTAGLLTTALTTPSKSSGFHKVLVAGLASQAIALANSQQGQNVLSAIISSPSKGEGITIPFHLKEIIISKLAENEKELRETWTGRNVWRTWKGDLWAHRRADWVRWAKETDPEGARQGAMPKPRHHPGGYTDKKKGNPMPGTKREKKDVSIAV